MFIMDGFLSIIKRVRAACPTLKLRELKAACDALIGELCSRLRA